jgi:hypothetical protein
MFFHLYHPPPAPRSPPFLNSLSLNRVSGPHAAANFLCMFFSVAGLRSLWVERAIRTPILHKSRVKILATTRTRPQLNLSSRHGTYSLMRGRMARRPRATHSFVDQVAHVCLLLRFLLSISAPSPPMIQLGRDL